MKKFIWALAICVSTAHAYSEVKHCFIKPTMREGAIEAIYELNTKCIMPHIVDVVLVENEKQISNLPYVVALADGSLIANSGEEIFAKGISDNRYTSFSFVTAYQKIADPTTGKSLGIQLELAGYAELLAMGEVQRLIIRESFEAIGAGFRLVPRKALNLPSTLYGVKPDNKLSGTIIGLHNYVTIAGNPGVISVNLGLEHGLKVGDLLEIYSQAKFALDPYLKKAVKLPGDKRAEVVIYKTTPKVSLGLIVEGFGVIDKFDEVVSFGDRT
jgi:hypothetical protein